jgi:hypothetical protein
LLRFAGEAFRASNDRRLGGAVGSSRIKSLSRGGAPGAAAPRSQAETASMIATGPKGIPETVHPWTSLISVSVD